MPPRTTMTTRCTHILLSLSLMLGTGAAWAGDLIVPNEFTAGERARAAEVNANFDAVEEQVTDNDARITAAQATADAAVAGHTADTQLSDSEVAVAAQREGFVTGAHTVDTNTQLSASEVAAAATSQGFVTGPHTVDTQLSDSEVATAATSQGFVTGPHTVDTDTQLNDSEVAAAAQREGFATADIISALEARIAVLEFVPRFEACNNGLTLADNTTGLLWERKTGTPITERLTDCSITECVDPHDVNNRYEWSLNEPFPDGKVFTDFLAALNAEQGFAGHSDWRLPIISELQSILVGQGVTFTSNSVAPVDSELGANATDQAVTCSAAPCIEPEFVFAGGGPTALASYWTSASDPADQPGGSADGLCDLCRQAWVVIFGGAPASSELPNLTDGDIGLIFKEGTNTPDSALSQGAVRAVRPGSCRT